MNTRSKYKTKQSTLLLQYLETVPGVHITAGDVCEYLKKQETPISQSTVYRQLEALVDEGLLQKYIIDANSPACFEYVGKAAHEESDNLTCFHCKCERCGKLIHLHCEELDEIREHMLLEHHFRIDPIRTVFYGLCEDCQKARVQEG